MALADDQYPTDSIMRQLQSFINLQYFACARGLVPGSLRDEASPFNECTHAYLAGTRALLLHLQTMPGDHTALRALSRQIDVAMLNNHASLVLCRFSDEPFNTADVIFPQWSNLARDLPSALTFVVLILATASLGGWASRRLIAAAR